MKVLPWSFSALETYLSCPRKYQALKVTKECKEDFSGPEAAFGDMVHRAIAAYVNENVPFPATFPEGIKQRVLTVLKELPDEGYRVAEIKGALSTQMDACDWFARNVWMRCILDILHTHGSEAYILDWKTGKVKEDSKQLKLFALYIFHTKPKIVRCHTAFEWVAYNKATKETFLRDDMEALWDDFMPDLIAYRNAHKEDRWEKKPSGLCKAYCPVLNCEHNGKRKGA